MSSLKDWCLRRLWRQQCFDAFEVRDFSQETLTHLPVLYKQNADGVLAAEVEYVNVVLNSHLQEWLHPREGTEEDEGWETRSNTCIITFQVPFKSGHRWFMCTVYWARPLNWGISLSLSFFYSYIHTHIHTHTAISNNIILVSNLPSIMQYLTASLGLLFAKKISANITNKLNI